MNISNFGIILYPSTRSLAYLNVLAKNHITPKEVIVMGKWPFLSKNILIEAEKYNYADKYFPIHYDLTRLNQDADIDFSSIKNTDINSEELKNILIKSNCKNFIFTGGGILRKEILSLDINFIHVHPGDTEYYRGSTCFYYSYLKNKTVSCTTFIMKAELDRGEILDIRGIDQNIFVNDDQGCFIDQIYDPLIRSLALEKALPFLTSTKKIKRLSVDNFQGEDHHVIHPALRYLFVKNINSAYKDNNKEGVYLANE